MAKSNRVLTIELRLLNVDDREHDAFKKLMEEVAKDLHASATLLVGSGSKPKIYVYGESYNVDIAKLVKEEADEASQS